MMKTTNENLKLIENFFNHINKDNYFSGYSVKSFSYNDFREYDDLVNRFQENSSNVKSTILSQMTVVHFKKILSSESNIERKIYVVFFHKEYKYSTLSSLFTLLPINGETFDILYYNNGLLNDVMKFSEMPRVKFNKLFSFTFDNIDICRVNSFGRCFNNEYKIFYLTSLIIDLRPHISSLNDFVEIECVVIDKNSPFLTNDVIENSSSEFFSVMILRYNGIEYIKTIVPCNSEDDIGDFEKPISLQAYNLLIPFIVDLEEYKPLDFEKEMSFEYIENYKKYIDPIQEMRDY